jgi:hypothetical protein
MLKLSLISDIVIQHCPPDHGIHPAATLSSFVSPERESRDVTSPRRPFVCCRSHVLHSLQVAAMVRLALNG